MGGLRPKSKPNVGSVDPLATPADGRSWLCLPLAERPSGRAGRPGPTGGHHRAQEVGREIKRTGNIKLIDRRSVIQQCQQLNLRRSQSLLRRFASQIRTLRAVAPDDPSPLWQYRRALYRSRFTSARGHNRQGSLWPDRVRPFPCSVWTKAMRRLKIRVRSRSAWLRHAILVACCALSSRSSRLCCRS